MNHTNGSSTLLIRTKRGWVGLAGLALTELVSAESFAASMDMKSASEEALHKAASEEWAAWTSSLAALNGDHEWLLCLSSSRGQGASSATVAVHLLVVARNPSEHGCRADLRRRHRTAEEVTRASLTCIDVDRHVNRDTLAELWSRLSADAGTEIVRREVWLRPAGGVAGHKTAGFCASNIEPTALPSLHHVYPWRAPCDAWRRLVKALTMEADRAAFVVHVRNVASAPEEALDAARGRLADIEALRHGRLEDPASAGSLFPKTLEALADTATATLAMMHAPCLAARVFLLSKLPPTDALTAVALTSLDHGGTCTSSAGLYDGAVGVTHPVPPREVIKPLSATTPSELFTPAEATCFFRLPTPPRAPLGVLPSARGRVVALSGRSGEDVLLGMGARGGNTHPVRMHGPDRSRHTYIIGQTGTGKSTLLAQMILHDLAGQDAVVVLDAHGSLIDTVLARLPDHRLPGLAILDLADVDHPVPFNPLAAPPGLDARSYLAWRDRTVEQLVRFTETHWPPETRGPIFETHVRGTIGMLLGTRRPPQNLTPNLMLLRRFFSSKRLRSTLAQRVGSTDLALADYLEESEAVRGEGSLQNTAPYLTSKFTRFSADAGLRRHTCQPHCLDIQSVLSKGGTLLVNLARGSVGAHAAGLIASQLVGRVRTLTLGRQLAGRRVHLHADEFQLFADRNFGELLAEARKFGLTLTLAHQFGSQLDEDILEAVLGNVGTLVSFRVGPTDAQRIGRWVAPTLTETDLLRMPNYRAAVRATGALGMAPFTIGTLPLGAGSESVLRNARAVARERHAVPRAQADASIRSVLAAYEALMNR